MKQKRNISFLILVLISISSFAIGLFFLFSSELILPHKELIGRNWAELDERLQIQFLKVIRWIGAGLMGIGVATLWSVYYPISQKWVNFALPILGLFLFFPLFYISLNANLKTFGSTPWYLFLLIIILIVIASTLSFYSHNKSE